MSNTLARQSLRSCCGSLRPRADKHESSRATPTAASEHGDISARCGVASGANPSRSRHPPQARRCSIACHVHPPRSARRVALAHVAGRLRAARDPWCGAAVTGPSAGDIAADVARDETYWAEVARAFTVDRTAINLLPDRRRDSARRVPRPAGVAEPLHDARGARSVPHCRRASHPQRDLVASVTDRRLRVRQWRRTTADHVAA